MPRPQMFDQPAEHRGLKLSSGFVVDRHLALRRPSRDFVTAISDITR
jgi:hypothetical protein